MRLHVRARALAFIALAGLAACGAKPERSPGPAELGLVSQRFDAELNMPALLLRKSLIDANADRRIYPEELVTPGRGSITPVDWWIYEQGLIRVAGVDSYYRGYFGLTPKGEAFVKAPPPRWLVSSLKGGTQATCAGSRAWVSCRIAGVAAVRPTAEGAALFKHLAVADQVLQGELEYGPQGWRAGDIQTTGGAEPSEAALLAFFGDAASIAKARSRFADKVNRQVR